MRRSEQIIIIGTPLGSAGMAAPAGFIFLVDSDGAFMVDDDGYFFVEAI
jgi:hypothetical protein